MPCHSLPYLDLSHWREEVTQCRVNGLDIELGSSRKISPCTSCTCTKEGVSEDYVCKEFWNLVYVIKYKIFVSPGGSGGGEFYNGTPGGWKHSTVRTVKGKLI